MIQKFIILLFCLELIWVWRRFMMYEKILQLAEDRVTKTGKRLFILGKKRNRLQNIYERRFGTPIPYNLPHIKDFDDFISKSALQTSLAEVYKKYVIFQSFELEYEKEIPSHLENFDSEDLFFVHIQPWSIFAYVNLIGKMPQRIFLRYPPKYSYVWFINNPIIYLKKYILFILLGYLFFTTVSHFQVIN